MEIICSLFVDRINSLDSDECNADNSKKVKKKKKKKKSKAQGSELVLKCVVLFSS